MKVELIDQYDRQVEIEYQGDTYLVRDNGAVCRKSRPGQRKRKGDDVWTFGRPDQWNGYMHIGTHFVHRIVAIAFYGDRPSEKHVVDHIDTNRRNNRAENLLWCIGLDNVLSNPISRKRIEYAHGSVDEFLRNLGTDRSRQPSFDWMRPVSRQEAEKSLKRSLDWAKSGKLPQGGQLGEWVYGARQPDISIPEVEADRQSRTPMAIQRNWRTPSEFPSCPDSIGSDPLGAYAVRLRSATLFSRNWFGETLTEVAGLGDGLLAVLCRLPQGGVKEWALCKITVEKEKFLHESVRTYFSLEGAVNAYCELVGLGAPFEDSIDDYC